MSIFENIQLKPQEHPTLSPESPFNILWEYGRGPEKKMQGDVHYALQISIVMQGRAEVTIGEHTRIYQQGDLWWTMCWEPHAYRLLDSRNFIMSVNINIDNIGNCGSCSDADWLAPFTVAPEYRYCPKDDADREEVIRLSNKLFHTYHRKKANWQTHSWLLIHELILHASEQIPANQVEGLPDNFAMNRIRKAVTLVRNSLIPPSLEAAAQACSLSVSRFSYLFHSSMGVSYGQFALRVRLTNAANDVKRGIYTLSEIAERHGFCDASSFCHAFRKVYRCTTHEFKKRSGSQEMSVLE